MMNKIPSIRQDKPVIVVITCEVCVVISDNDHIIPAEEMAISRISVKFNLSSLPLLSGNKL